MNERECKHVHITERTKTVGTPYLKGYCQICKAWVYTEKNFCVCCFKRVNHKVHKFGLRKILNAGLQEHKEIIQSYKEFPYIGVTYLSINHKNRVYHIPVKYLALYDEHPHPNEIMSLIQDSLKIVK